MTSSIKVFPIGRYPTCSDGKKRGTSSLPWIKSKRTSGIWKTTWMTIASKTEFFCRYGMSIYMNTRGHWWGAPTHLMTGVGAPHQCLLEAAVYFMKFMLTCDILRTLAIIIAGSDAALSKQPSTCQGWDRPDCHSVGSQVQQIGCPNFVALLDWEGNLANPFDKKSRLHERKFGSIRVWNDKGWSHLACKDSDELPRCVEFGPC